MLKRISAIDLPKICWECFVKKGVSQKNNFPKRNVSKKIFQKRNVTKKMFQKNVF
jgi:hypothetical protein